MRRANGSGTIVKMTGNRRKPYAIRKIVGWKEDGRPMLKYISYHRTKREAEQALNKYNEDPYALSRITLEDLYNEWIGVQEREKAASTIRCYKFRFFHLKPLYDTRISEIDAFTLEDLYTSLDVSKGTIRDVQVLLNLMFKYAVKRKYLPVSALNLSKSINMPDKEEVRLKPHSVVTTEEIHMLWQIKDSNEYAKLMLFYIYTGMRYSELKGLNVEDWHDNYVEIKQAKTKAGIRIVPICDKLRSLLPIMKVPPHTTFDRYVKLLLPGHAIHDFRHTFISMMTEKNIDIRIVKAIVGHKMSDVTAIYTHISLEAMLEAVNQL